MSIIGNFDEYQYWRDEKLANAVNDINECWLEIDNPRALTAIEKDKIQQLCYNNNFVLFTIKEQDDYADAIVQINHQLGLLDYDKHLYAQNNGLAYITRSDNQTQSEFIPYTNKAIGWHTDGYYNASDNQVRSFSLFCVRPANIGGVNQWIDPQMVYLLLREDNIDVVKALSHPSAMSIPEHKIDGQIKRAKSIGPIFFIDKPSTKLYMRYTQRKKNVEFLDSLEIKQAVSLLDDLLNTTTPYHFEYTMRAKQGIICNNILHNRSAFVDNCESTRLLLRGRYTNRIV